MIKIYGHSDDCFEFEGKFIGENEYSCFDVPVSVKITDVENGTGAIVTGHYAKNNRAPVWNIAIEQIDEDKPLPKISIETYSNGYSPQVTIECSETTVVSEIK